LSNPETVNTDYIRPLGVQLAARLREERRFIQVLAGPRQTGKTTLARQILARLDLPAHYSSADDPALQDAVWIAQQWDVARLNAYQAGAGGALLVLDEIQKIPRWSDAVKRLWDEDTHRGVELRVLLLGSAPLLVQKSLTESLAGRFEILPATHWSFAEMRAAFGWALPQHVIYGAYPGAAPLINVPERWVSYIRDALIETTLGRDILLMTRVDKPALLRRLFHLACAYSGQILSYQKMVGQLQDAGNTTTLAHYLELLDGAGMVAGLPKYAGTAVRQRSSSPKLQVHNTALITAVSARTFDEVQRDRDVWGRLVESAVGAHLVNASRVHGFGVFYWRERNHEVDFVVQRGRQLVAIEVKSGRHKENLPGMQAFASAFRPTRTLLVGGEGLPVERFLEMPVTEWLAD
jgi:predicted AAA+ superfamily ATPase